MSGYQIATTFGLIKKFEFPCNDIIQRVVIPLLISPPHNISKALGNGGYLLFPGMARLIEIEVMQGRKTI